MKINPLGPLNNPYQKQTEAQRPAKQENQQQEKDKVEISDQAKHMQQGNDIEASRQEKIDQLKHQVQSGEYEFDPQEAARKFAEFWSGK
ncbi:flagellar biosynthesis anti-sigma factor FlgM [Salibacterium aidingense]|uniref:flagellar biosynthesis anti-sigma factor FlgM n=1 Tax=Salibacterium aidingense TaxID=384933 RepID=UPI00040BB1F9|nr:flagellar biosynthesis anti-sigma factor FlgM [Salibacterium aidingense]